MIVITEIVATKVIVKIETNAIDWAIPLLMERGVNMVSRPITPYMTAASIQNDLPVSIATF